MGFHRNASTGSLSHFLFSLYLNSSATIGLVCPWHTSGFCAGLCCAAIERNGAGDEEEEGGKRRQQSKDGDSDGDGKS